MMKKFIKEQWQGSRFWREQGNGEKLTLEGSFKLYTYIVWFYSLVIDLMNVIYW